MHLRLACFLSGLVLYNVVVLVDGVLAAVTIPHAYFEWFRESRTLGLVLLDAATFAVPIFVLCTAWSFVTARAFRNAARKASVWTLAGFGAGWLGWLAVFAPSLPSEGSVAAALAALVIPPVWGVLPFVAGPLGVFVAGVLASSRTTLVERPV